MSSALVAAPKGGRKYKGKTRTDRLAEGEQMLLDRSHGMRLSELAAKYGVGKVTVANRLKMALNERLATTVDDYREQQNASLDHLMSRQATALELAERMIRLALTRMDFAAVEVGLDRLDKVTQRMLSIHDRRSKLNGLDRPVQVDMTITEQTEADAELAELVREAKAKSAAVEQELRNGAER